LPIRENFEWFGKNPVDTLSNPTTSRVAASRKDTVPTPRYIITQSNNPMAIILTPICKNLNHVLEEGHDKANNDLILN